MRWGEFEAQQPALAGVGARKLTGPGVVLVGTVRRDGSPRISPVEPLLWDGDLWLCMGLGSHKAADLRRDHTILVHSIVTNRTGQDGEYKVRGTAVEEADPDTQALRRTSGRPAGMAARAGEVPSIPRQPRRRHVHPLGRRDQRPVRDTLASRDRSRPPRHLRHQPRPPRTSPRPTQTPLITLTLPEP
jgi:hypothetical protein